MFELLPRPHSSCLGHLGQIQCKSKQVLLVHFTAMIYHSWIFDYYCSIQWPRNPSSAPRSTSWSGRKITAASLPSLAMHCTARWKMRSVAIGKSKLCASITAELRQDPCHLWSETCFFFCVDKSFPAVFHPPDDVIMRPKPWRQPDRAPAVWELGPFSSNGQD